MQVLDEIIKRIEDTKSKKKEPILVAIDGRCASGKTSLAADIEKRLGCPVIHMDDFFLRPEQRTEERLSTPGENIDHERFLEEVILPFKKNESFYYRPFDCKTMSCSPRVEIHPSPIVLIEGSYSGHKSLRSFYDACFFLSVEPTEQIERLKRRNPEKIEQFLTKWIPLEEAYINAYPPETWADGIFSTSS